VGEVPLPKAWSALCPRLHALGQLDLGPLAGLAARRPAGEGPDTAGVAGADGIRLLERRRRLALSHQAYPYWPSPSCHSRGSRGRTPPRRCHAACSRGRARRRVASALSLPPTAAATETTAVRHDEAGGTRRGRSPAPPPRAPSAEAALPKSACLASSRRLICDNPHRATGRLIRGQGTTS
jgi:hypothetical protein